RHARAPQLAALVVERDEHEPSLASIGGQARGGVELGDREVARIAIQRLEPRPLPRAPEPDARLGLGRRERDRAAVRAARQQVLLLEVAQPAEQEPVAGVAGLERERIFEVALRSLVILDRGVAAVLDLEGPAVE